MHTFRSSALLFGALVTSACEPSSTPSGDSPFSDSSNPVIVDAALPQVDAALPPSGAGPASDASASAIDAAVVLDANSAREAGSAVDAGSLDGASNADASGNDAAAIPDGATSDATTSDAAISDAASATKDGSSPEAGTGTCAGSTPHGCWPAKADNPMGCPPQIHEQSTFYPPTEEWVDCSSPFYEPCNYVRPDGTDGHCECDLGVHWLCTY
jgi:hypothetical protein